MKTILMPDIHVGLSKNLCEYFRRLGCQIIIPSKYKITHYPPPPVQQWLFRNDWGQAEATSTFGANVTVMNKEEILDSKIDLVLLTNYECQFELMKEIVPNISGCKVAVYSGNRYWDGAYDLANTYKNYLWADFLGGQLAAKYQVPNAKFIIPFIYPEKSKVFAPSLTNIIGCYINNYQKNFPSAYQFYKKLVEISPGMEHILMENKPVSEVYDAMGKSAITLHCKNEEGCGIASLESLAFGRPLILHRQLAREKSLLRWSIPYLSAFFIENGRDFAELTQAITQNPEILTAFQRSAYDTVRRVMVEEEQLETLKKFLENLV